MGIFDFFKKKKTEHNEEIPILNEAITLGSVQPTTSVNDSYRKNSGKEIIEHDTISDPVATHELFTFIFKYNEYVVNYLHMMFQGNNSPIAAYEKPDGELIGYLYIGEDMSYNLSVEQVIEKMEVEFEKRIAAGIILSWTIFYHSEFNDDDNYKVASELSKTSAITVKYRSGEEIGYAAIPYILTEDEVKYKGFSGFSIEQNRRILSVNLVSDKDYFQERIEIKPEIYENEAGLKIKKVNNGSLGNMWGGIFGFNRLGKSSQILLEYVAFTFSSSSVKGIPSGISVYELNYGDVIFRGIKAIDDSMRTCLPAIRNTNYIEVLNKQINEWENSNNLEAVISGGGRDTFGVTYFATDYAENKNLYHSKPKLNIAFSGIIFVLAENENREIKTTDGVTTFADGFAAYIPHKDLAEFGCYDFIEVLEDFNENKILEGNSATGYILKVRLINNEEIADFFTIPMFVNSENMRISTLKRGMNISGTFQLLGEIKNS